MAFRRAISQIRRQAKRDQNEMPQENRLEGGDSRNTEPLTTATPPRISHNTITFCPAFNPWQEEYDRVRAAHDLLHAVAAEHNVDVIIVAEPNRKIAEAEKWNCDLRGDAAIIVISTWMTTHRLRLAPEKNEAIMLSGRKKHDPITYQIDDQNVQSVDQLKYLGIILDKNMRFNKRVEEIANKAEKLTTALTRLMPNHGGPRASRRRVLISVALSIMLYGAPIWGQAMQVDSYMYKLRRIQRRLAMRVCGAYCIVSCEAALVIAGVIPIERLVTARVRLYQQRTAPGKGAWTRRIIRNIGTWIAREHGEVNYYLTQALTGHGIFNTFLYAIGKANNEECKYCGTMDTPDHAIFECGHFAADRAPALEGGNTITQDNLIERMLTSKDK
ncbi:hypothetical protein NQ314_017575 [Rhamnusium bicolor]|uniref:Reverse transcriptase n=1 Tax=Rhamnusium bicolor TaxID=1586634 RepID=A0AAV8WT19_9CUCU|nr:hypothetical protein NQ314_017575 [Rhamnusium bicolor]